MTVHNRPLGAVLFALGAGVAAVALLGPLGLQVLQHRTSETTLNQLLGADAVSLLVVAPLCFVVGTLAWRGHRAAPVLALAPSVYAVYTFAQVVLGQEYLQLPGNIEHFFPLLLAVFVLGGTAAVSAWTGVGPLPSPGRRLERTAAVTLLLLAAFLTLGLHLPTLVDALGAEPTRVEYVSSPTAFWVVKLMDLGILVPVALVTGVGLLRGRAWARKPMYAVLGAYTLIGTSVVAMAVVMLVNDDPDGSAELGVGFGLFAAALAALTVALYRPLLRPDRAAGPGSQSAQPSARATMSATDGSAATKPHSSVGG